MARQYWISGNEGDRRRDEVVVRICRQATAIDPDYARAWALMALAQVELRFWHGIETENGLPAAERALALDPDIAEAYCVKARYLQGEGKHAEANAALDDRAAARSRESWEVNKEAAHLTFRQGRIARCHPLFRKGGGVDGRRLSRSEHADDLLQRARRRRERRNACAQMTIDAGRKGDRAGSEQRLALGTGGERRSPRSATRRAPRNGPIARC